ncbi:MAG: FHA domain-containing protein, partial [Myxococcota bacterium]|nr:FHA domain-containing protein [Myxococcota bacterium]
PAPPGSRGAGPLVPPSSISVPPIRTPFPIPAPPVRGSGLASMPPLARSIPPATRTVPPPLPRGGANGLTAPVTPTLTLVYQGERVPVTKERFIIGRGKQASDLTLKDPNVSRQHAMVELQNGVHFMVDMGSTNGVEFDGQRVARKQIAEGDVFRICDHEITFTYR